jgi:hypothetical protein
MNQGLRFSNVYETSMQVTANNPKIVSGFIDDSSLIHRPGTLVPMGVPLSAIGPSPNYPRAPQRVSPSELIGIHSSL